MDNLEKGAWLFYQHIMDRYPDDPIRPTLEQVAIAEKAHLRALTRALNLSSAPGAN